MRVTFKEITNIVINELKNQRLFEDNNGVDHKQINLIVTTASKLSSAIDDFKSKAPEAIAHSVTQQLSDIKKLLDNMVTNPGSYIVRQKKKITLVPKTE